MRRFWIGGALVTVLALGLATWLAWGWALGTCGAWDRLRGDSGCVARHYVSDIRPLGFSSMVPIDEDRVRIFGNEDRGEEVVPIQLVFDLQSSTESEREDLPLRAGHYAIHASRDNRQVAIICVTSDLCDAADPQGYVLSVADGSVAGEIEKAPTFGWTFPGEPPRTVFGGVWLSDTISAEPDMVDGSIILRNRERERIGRFSPERPGEIGAGPSAMAVRLSPSGQYLAMIDSSRIGTSRIDIYEVASRTLVRTISTSGDRKVDTNAVWSPDERHLILFQDWNAIPTDRRGKGTELYVFKVR